MNMPMLLRVECYFTFSDIKTIDSLRFLYTPELRRFSLRLEDTNIINNNTLYEQLLQNIEPTLRHLSPGLVSDGGQPFRLYWKGKYSIQFTAFESKAELLEAIYDMLRFGPISTVYKSDVILGTPISSDVLTICVCIPNKVATTSISPTITSSTTIAPPPTTDSQSAIATVQSKVAVSVVAAEAAASSSSSSDDSSSDWYDVINIDKVVAE